MGKCQTASSLAIALFSVVVVFGPSDAAAQGAWVGDKGNLDLGLDYNFAKSDKVVADGDAPDFDEAGTTTHQFVLSGEYVPIPKLAINLQVPLVMLSYNGELNRYPHPGGGTYDDGDLHTTLTDLRFGARYQVLDSIVAISPHIAASIPLADYEVIGNTVAGRGLMMLHVGAGIGYQIGLLGYAHLLYEFSLGEKFDETPETKQHSQNRSDLGFTIGRVFLDNKLNLHADVNLRRTHGGVNFSDFADLSGSEQDFHDAILKENMLLVGGGIGYQISPALAVNLTARFFVTGDNTQNANVLGLGVAWSPIQ